MMPIRFGQYQYTTCVQRDRDPKKGVYVGSSYPVVVKGAHFLLVSSFESGEVEVHELDPGSELRPVPERSSLLGRLACDPDTFEILPMASQKKFQPEFTIPARDLERLWADAQQAFIVPARIFGIAIPEKAAAAAIAG